MLVKYISIVSVSMDIISALAEGELEFIEKHMA
jgi:hypothetical protein